MDTLQMPDVTSVRDLMRYLREQRALTQTDMARILGATQGAIAKWEAGTHRVSFDTVTDFAAALNVPLDWFAEARKREKASTANDGGQMYAPRDSNPEPADYGSTSEALAVSVADTADELISRWSTSRQDSLDAEFAQIVSAW